MQRRSRFFAVAGLSLFCSGVSIASGCGGDDSVAQDNGDGDASSIDGAVSDARVSDGTIDAQSSKDAEGDATIIDAETDAHVPLGPPAHVAFVTAEMFSGNLIGAANAIADGGVGAPDGGIFTDYQMAADALCTDSAHAAGRAGVYDALLNHNGNIVPTPEFSDADGPWALADGTPFAANVADLANGRVRALLSQAADGSESANVAVWVGVSTENCKGWSSASASDHGVSGTIARVGGALYYTGAPQCSSLGSLMCFQVGAGGGPLVYPPLPVGAKIAFATEQNVPLNFASPDSGVLDGGVASGDAVHATADAICNQVARGAGQPGKFHAFIVSSTKSESAYFSSLSMNGPWYRADGFEIAPSLDALELNGSETEIAFGANGTFVSDVGDGVIAVGAVGANCSDFTSLVSAPVLVGFAAVPGTNAISFFDEDCSASPFGLYCFQE